MSATHRDSVVVQDALPGWKAVYRYLPESLNLCTDRVTLSQSETIYKLESDPHSTTLAIDR